METGKGLVELTGRPDAVVFPDVCASCAAPAGGQRLRVEKAFRRPAGDSSTHVVVRMDVPFCTACVAKHHAESPEPSSLRTTLTIFRSVAMLPAVGRVRKPSSVTGAFDFSDDTSGTFERRRRTYRLANPAFGEAFAAANAERAR